MGLVGESDFVIMDQIMNILEVILLDAIFSGLFFPFVINGLDLLDQVVMLGKELVGVNLCNGVDGDVGSLMLKAPMDIHIGVHCPARVSESLERVELVPFTGLSVINLQGNHFSYLVGSPSNDHHQWAQEQSSVLIARDGLVPRVFVGSSHPVPPSISMLSESPAIIEAALVSSSPPKDYHHPSGAPCLTEGCRVVDSHGRVFFSTVELDPRERSFLHAQAPDITDCLLACVPSKHEQMRLLKDDSVSISSSRGRTHHRNYHPLS